MVWRQKLKTRINIKRYFQVLGISLSVLLVFVLGVLGFKIYNDFGAGLSADHGLSKEEIATVKLQERTDRVNILVLGVDEGGMRSDTIMLVSYDPKSNEVNALSIPRDTRISAGGKIRKINATSAYKSSNGKAIGPQGVVEAVSRLTGVPIHYYISFTFDGVAECIDALGPVEYTIEKPMVYNDPTQDLHINLKPGKQKLNGEQCVHFLRYRKGDKGYASYGDGSDTSRIEKQQEFLKEVMRQKFNAKILLKIPDILQAVTKNVKTNLSVDDLIYYTTKMTDYNAINFASKEVGVGDIHMVGGEDISKIRDDKTLTVRMLSLAGRNSENGEFDASYWICDIEKTKQDVMMYFGVDEETASKITIGEAAEKSKGNTTKKDKTSDTKKTSKPTQKATQKTTSDNDDDDDVKTTKKPSSTTSTKKTEKPTSTKKPDTTSKATEKADSDKDDDKVTEKEPVTSKSPTKEPVKSTPEPAETKDEKPTEPTKAPVVQKKEE